MTKVIEVGENGAITPAQAEKFDLGVAEVINKTLTILGSLSPEQMLDIQNRPNESEHTLNVVQQVFHVIVAADLPRAYNQVVAYKAMSTIQTVFEQIGAKLSANEESIVEKAIGLSYNDISPKDIVDHLTKEEVK